MDIERKIQFDPFYLIASKEFYETLDNLKVDKSKDFLKEIKDIIPSQWLIENREVWYFLIPKNLKMEHQGFKIHISAIPQNANSIIKKIAKKCIDMETPFKFLKNLTLLEIMNSRSCPRGSSGKFITIYPKGTQFREIIEKIYLELENYEGPYILSDMRYKDSKSVYYRYGGFKNIFVLNEFGEKIPMIFDISGKLIPDDRVPFYKLPKGINDPFGRKIRFPKKVILNRKYLVESAIFVSNAGGIYEATDRDNDRKVIIKERRPFVDLTEEYKIDSVELLKNEYNILKELENCEFVPKVFDFFKEWEHYFLVLEHIEGYPLSNFRADEDFNILLKTNITYDEVEKFYFKFKKIAHNIVNAIEAIHKYGVIISDISPNNIIVNPETLEIKIIDFESALFINNRKNFFPLKTLGFFSKNKKSQVPNFNDDFFAVKNILYNLLYPIEQFFYLSPKSKSKFLDIIINEKKLPKEIKTLILYPQKIIYNTDNKMKSNNQTKNENKNNISINKIRKIIDGIATYIENNADYSRTDRLFPSDPKVFTTNPLNISYGALGQCIFLNNTKFGISKGIRKWISERIKKLDISNYPPGLGIGLSGISIALYKMGLKDEAEGIIMMSYKSPLYFKNLDLFYGLSGEGLASIYFFDKTNKEIYLDKAKEAGSFILQKLEKENGNYFFVNTDGEIYFGFFHGASGLAYFLFKLFFVTKEEKFLDASLKLMNFEIKNGIKKENYIYWKKSKNSPLFEPYLQFGGSGIGSVLIRFYYKLKENKFKENAELCANYLKEKISVSPSLYSGLAGIGEFFLDMYYITNNEDYFIETKKCVRKILCFQIKKDKGIAFPGIDLLRISTDFGTGSAGIGCFLSRFVDKNIRRFFYDIF